MGERKGLAKQGMFAAAGILMITTLISGILGFVREQVMTSKFGLTFKTDAYIAAFSIPDFLYTLLVGGVMGAAFIPVFRTYLSKDKEEDAWIIASTLINVVLILMFISMVLGMIFTPSLIPLVAYGFTGETKDLAVTLTRIMLPAVVLTGLNGIMLGMAHSYKHFLIPAFGSIFYNIAIIGTGLLLSKYFGIAAFAIGVIVGIIGNTILQYITLRKIGIKYRPIINLKHPGVRKLGLLMIPAIIGLSANHVNLIVNQNFASLLADDGSITALRLANRLMILPLSVFAMSIAIAAFPTLTEQAASNKMKEYKDTLSMGIRSISFLTVPAGIGFMVIGIPIIRVLFEQFEFTPTDTALTASVLFFYSFTLFAQGITGILTRGFYSLQNTIIPVTISVTSILINYLLNLTLIGPMGVQGIALAFSITAMINVLALFFMLRRKIGPLGFNRIFFSFGQIIFASSIMAMVAYGVSFGIESYLDITVKINQIIQVGVSIVLAGLTYIAVTWFMKMEEAQRVLNTFARRFRRTT